MKLSKGQLRDHKIALELLEKSNLSRYERWDVLAYYQPAADVADIGFFQTPHADAQSVAWDGVDSGRILDLGAGIGMLTYHVYYDIQDSGGTADIVALEKDPRLVEIGKKIMPEAEWICGDMYDKDLVDSLGRFNIVVSNPPFGITVDSDWLPKHRSELLAILVAMSVSDNATFILPSVHHKLAHSTRGVEEQNTMEDVLMFKAQYPYRWQLSNFPTEDTYRDTKMKTSIINIYGGNDGLRDGD